MESKILKTERGPIQPTCFFEQLISPEAALKLYELLQNRITWGEGIISKRSGHTRHAVAMSIQDTYGLIKNAPFGDKVWTAIKTVIDENSIRTSCQDVYINYYKTGEEWTPNHTHKGTSQFVLSLGQTRTLVIGKKKFVMSSGDAALFGSSMHGVPKDPSVNEGRISIAFFLE
jgi:hypothetical protein